MLPYFSATFIDNLLPPGYKPIVLIQVFQHASIIHCFYQIAPGKEEKIAFILRVLEPT